MSWIATIQERSSARQPRSSRDGGPEGRTSARCLRRDVTRITDGETNESDYLASTHDLLDGVPLTKLAKPTAFENLDVVMAKSDLAAASVELSTRAGGERYLAEALPALAAKHPSVGAHRNLGLFGILVAYPTVHGLAYLGRFAGVIGVVRGPVASLAAAREA